MPHKSNLIFITKLMCDIILPAVVYNVHSTVSELREDNVECSSHETETYLHLYTPLDATYQPTTYVLQAFITEVLTPFKASRTPVIVIVVKLVSSSHACHTLHHFFSKKLETGSRCTKLASRWFIVLSWPNMTPFFWQMLLLWPSCSSWPAHGRCFVTP